ncbi:MAG: hypothetical protein R2822_08120 [Spirosomataceae bacterium]
MFLRAGSFHILYEKGFLRQIKQDDLEIIRMMYFALRDHNWGTFSYVIENEVIENHQNHFWITYTLLHLDESSYPIFAWEVKIEGKADNTIVFEIAGKALQDVLKNRAGFCILHPIEGTAQQPVTIFHGDSSQSDTHFPRFIAAQDPFLNIKSMRWQVANGISYQLDFEGDIFQTEDQRNWGDASYKTFCTPLSLPFPVQLYQGDTVWQRVSLSQMATPSPTVIPPISFTKSFKPSLFSMGIAVSIESDSLPATAIDLLKSLALSHYRIDINSFQENWITTFSQHCETASVLDLPLEIALTLNDQYDTQLQSFVFLCEQNKLNIRYLILFSSQSLTTPQTIIDYVPFLKQQLPKVKIGVGTDYNFTELNRQRFQAGEADFISFSYHPQVHAFDDLSLMENTETLRYQIESATNLYHKPVHISFISLHKRANPYATNIADVSVSIEKQIDSRQKTTFGAAWLKAVLRSLSQTEVASVTIFRTHWRVGYFVNRRYSLSRF